MNRGLILALLMCALFWYMIHDYGILFETISFFIVIMGGFVFIDTVKQRDKDMVIRRDQLAPPCRKCGQPWTGEYCDHE